MAELYRYAAFISYSSKDAAFARRLHRSLESYRVPSSVGKFDLIGGGKANRIYPVFLDREELGAGQLGELIEANLKASAALVVVCSPDGAASPWVQKEIEFFAALGRHEKVYAIISAAAPLTGADGADATSACFPPAFRGAALVGDKLEPLAADARKGRDGFRKALLKIVAGLVGVSQGRLIDRDKTRRRRRSAAATFMSLGLTLVLGISAAAFSKRSVRADFTAYADVLEAEKRPIDAIAFAIAGLPARGDVLSVSHPSADSVAVEVVGGAPLVADFGAVLSSQLRQAVPNVRRFLVVQEAGQVSDGTPAWLYDLANAGAEPRALGRISGYELSSNERFLATYDPERLGGNVWIHDLQMPNERPIKLGRLLAACGRSLHFSHDGRYVLFQIPHPDCLGEAGVVDRRNVDALLMQVGRIQEAEFAPNDRFVLTLSPYDEGSRGSLRDLSNPTAAPIRLGRVGAFAFSADGNFLAVRDNQTIRVASEGRLYDLRRPSSPPRALGDISLLDFSQDGRFLLTRDDPEAGANGLLYDLGTAPSAPLPVGPVCCQRYSMEGEFFSPGGRFLLTQDLSGAAFLHDLQQPGRRAHALGSLSSHSFSATDAFLIVHPPDNDGDSRLIRLNDAALRTSTVQVRWPFGFSRFRDIIATRDQNGRGWIVDPHDLSLPRLPLGGIDDILFSADGNHLITLDSEDVGNNRAHAVLRDLRNISRRQGAALRSDLCRASGHTLRPFPRDVRLAQTSSGLNRELRGRPWNPCDWRGLLSLFPNQEAGDGWFEGIRQWVRLLGIRYLGAQDWRCEESVTHSSRQTREQRRRMCNGPLLRRSEAHN